MIPLNAEIANAPILIVDDVELNRNLIVKALQKAGYTNLATAGDGKEALEKTYLLKPALVILDIVMPILDGFGYCERLRKNSEFDAMPILVQTGLNDNKTKLQALSTGANDFLYKPVDQSELVLRTRIHLERYMAYKEKENMCQYLSMELEHLERMMSDIASGKQSAATRSLDNHRDVLKTIQLINNPKVA